MPQNLPALTAQDAEGEGGTPMEVDVVEVVCEVEVVLDVIDVVSEVAEVGFEVDVVPLVTPVPVPGTRYQLDSGSLRHSPAVTPFQPLAWIRPK